MLMRGERMSKTRGNILDPGVAAALFGVDGVRYVVLREIPFDRDGEVTAESLVRRYNAELANDLGNLLNRTVSMSARYLERTLPPIRAADAAADLELQRAAAAAVQAYHAAMGRFHLDEALGAVMDLTSAANGYAESQAPWARNKEGDHARVGAILAAMAEVCRILGHLMAPFTPAAAAELHAQLGVAVPYDDHGAGGPGLDRLLGWGSIPDGWQTGDAQPLFPRVELPEADAEPAGSNP
jgi:methionyl-tRNA synthetase